MRDSRHVSKKVVVHAPGPPSPPSPACQVSCQPVGWLSCTLRESRAGGLIFALLPRQFPSLRMPNGCFESGRKIQRFPVGKEALFSALVLANGIKVEGSDTLPKSTQPVSSPGCQCCKPPEFSNSLCAHLHTSQEPFHHWLIPLLLQDPT